MDRKNILPVVTLICVMIINITTLLNGIKHHEDYMIVIGAIGCGLMLIAFILQGVKRNKEKKSQAL